MKLTAHQIMQHADMITINGNITEVEVELQPNDWSPIDIDAVVFRYGMSSIYYLPLGFEIDLDAKGEADVWMFHDYDETYPEGDEKEQVKLRVSMVVPITSELLTRKMLGIQ